MKRLALNKWKKAVVRLSDKQIKTVKLKNNSFWEKVQRTFFIVLNNRRIMVAHNSTVIYLPQLARTTTSRYPAVILVSFCR